MKIPVLSFFVLFYFSLNSFAKESCITTEQASMGVTAELYIPMSPYSVGICYLPEIVNDGVMADHRDLIVLKKNNKPVAKQQTKMHITVGRIADLKLEKTSERFVAVSYTAGEFCNGIVIFDVRTKKVAAEQGCISFSDQCRVIELLDHECSATIECADTGAEGEPPQRKNVINKKFKICKTS